MISFTTTYPTVYFLLAFRSEMPEKGDLSIVPFPLVTSFFPAVSRPLNNLQS